MPLPLNDQVAAQLLGGLLNERIATTGNSRVCVVSALWLEGERASITRDLAADAEIENAQLARHLELAESALQPRMQLFCKPAGNECLRRLLR